MQLIKLNQTECGIAMELNETECGLAMELNLTDCNRGESGSLYINTHEGSSVALIQKNKEATETFLIQLFKTCTFATKGVQLACRHREEVLQESKREKLNYFCFRKRV